MVEKGPQSLGYLKCWNASFKIMLISCGRFDKEEKADFHCPTIMKVSMDTRV